MQDAHKKTRWSKKRTKWTWFGRTVSLFLSLFMLFAIGSIVALLMLRSQSLPASSNTQRTDILDVHGQVIDSFQNGQNREPVSLNQISPWLIKATLAIEDHRFYSHVGFDPTGVARAVTTNIKAMSMEQGASTITQQLARNLYLNHERTWSRKLKEALYTIQLELHLSKDEILEQYLNQIYYGFSTYGIEAASQMYFGKSAKDLSLAESALLAGVPKGPKYYSPYLNMENAMDRQKLVLDAMVSHGDITQAQADRAEMASLAIQPRGEKKEAIAPYFRDYVHALAAEKLGVTEDAFAVGGYRVYTTLDSRMQKVAEETLASQLNQNDDLQAALIAIDPRSGHVKAMVGGKRYDVNQFNRVFASNRQPGSTFKPFVYLAALERGFTALTKYRSEPTTFTYDNGRQTYTPSNFGGKYFGAIDMREAIARSDNMFAVHTALDVGPDQVVQLAQRMGVTSPLQPLPALALGAFPVSPFEMATAYGILANKGVRVESSAILRIETMSGKTVYTANPQEEQVIDPAHAYVLTNLMQSVFDDDVGTGHRVSERIKRPVAGKTGSTDTDAWLVGFTPQLSVAVWVGHDRDEKISAVESYKAAPIFAGFLEGALEPVPPMNFDMPDSVQNVYIDTVTGKLANEACPHARMEAFVQGTAPTEYCAESNSNTKENKVKSDRSWWNDLKRWWNS